jgi:hypothetical protein
LFGAVESASEHGGQRETKKTLASPVPAELTSVSFQQPVNHGVGASQLLSEHSSLRGEQYEPGIYSSGAWTRLHAVTQHGADRLTEIFET